VRSDSRSVLRHLFDWILLGELKVRIGATYPLAHAARAHADMEARGTVGKLLLLPEDAA
jgi:NADPH2:quinone reductase